MTFLDKFKELDKAMKEKVMAELKGQIIVHDCPDCKGTGHHLLRYGSSILKPKCLNCDGTGEIKIQY